MFAKCWCVRPPAAAPVPAPRGRVGPGRRGLSQHQLPRPALPPLQRLQLHPAGVQPPAGAGGPRGVQEMVEAAAGGGGSAGGAAAALARA